MATYSLHHPKFVCTSWVIEIKMGFVREVFRSKCLMVWLHLSSLRESFSGYGWVSLDIFEVLAPSYKGSPTHFDSREHEILLIIAWTHDIVVLCIALAILVVFENRVSKQACSSSSCSWWVGVHIDSKMHCVLDVAWLCAYSVECI